ncbi:MAG: putative phage tail protein [Paraclostridium sp.]
MGKYGDLISRLPPGLQNKSEYIEINTTSDTEIDFIWNRVDDAFKDQYLYEITEYGIKRWEKIMRITPKSSETLDDRRFRIINRFLNKIPFTMRSLQNTLSTLCGEDGYKIEYINNTFTLKIKLELKVKHQIDEVKRTLYHIVPTNIVQDISLIYNQYITLAKFTHEQLSVYTHKQLREEQLTNGRN